MTNGELILKRLQKVVEIDNCGLTDSEVEAIIDKAIKDNTKDEISITWCIEDVKSLDDSLTDEECRDVLEIAKDNHDAEWGLSWATLQVYIDQINEYKEENK